MMLCGLPTPLAGAGLAGAILLAGGLLMGASPGAVGASLRAELLAAPVTPDLGGATTRVIATDAAFTYIAENAPKAHLRPFFFGNRVFNTNWVTYPASVTSFDGLGPTFNRNACDGCHVRDGRGRPPETPGGAMESMLVRLSVRLPDGTVAPDPRYGDQLNEQAILGVVPEGHTVIDTLPVAGTYGDGTPYTLAKPVYRFTGLAFGPLDDDMISPRVASQMIGLGLLESVPLSTLQALADPDDGDRDGISGRINWLKDAAGKPVAGRFGWKANVATLRDQAAGAALGDIGLTSSLNRAQNCPAPQAACLAAAAQAEPELKDDFLDKLVLYARTLAVPVQRDPQAPAVVVGEKLFRAFGCADCHMPTLKTAADAPLPELAGQTFHPFTDLLLHDMGPDLADNRPDGSATGTEWRTPPLWGLGLVPRVNGHDRLLHDGRARGFAEAILWHGGEALKAREAFRNASAADRAALVAFLGSL
jgi:CxxC motif-containing protein (DUF1111 family)